MKRIKFLTMLGLMTFLPSAVVGNGWAPSGAKITEDCKRFFKGKSPEEIARYLVHPYSAAAGGAAQALADHGKKALPLIERLLKDSHPGVRLGALKALAHMYAEDKTKSGESEERELTPELARVLATVASMTDDPNEWVKGALGGVVKAVGIQNEHTHKVVLRMAASPDPGIRASALNMGRHWIKDPKVVVRIGTTVSAAPEGNTPRHWDLAHYILQQHKPHARESIPTIARFLNREAHRQRGMFSDGAHFRGLDIIEHHWDKSVERTPELVKGLCRCYVRVPYCDYPGWVRTREQVRRLLDKLSPESAPAIRKAVAAERQWLEKSSEASLKRATETAAEKARGTYVKFLRDLEELATRLEKGAMDLRGARP